MSATAISRAGKAAGRDQRRFVSASPIGLGNFRPFRRNDRDVALRDNPDRLSTL